jgi:hypothetical protein
MQKLFPSVLLPYLMFVMPVQAQEYPGTPADKKEYEQEMRMISDAGIAQRDEWKFSIMNGNVTSNHYKTGEIRYDRIGRIKETSSFDENGFIRSIVVYKYDSCNSLLSETEFTGKGELLGKTLYTYDHEGFLIEKTVYNSFEYIVSKTTCEANIEQNIFIRRIMFSPDSIKKKIIHCYTDLTNGYITEEQVFKGNNILEHKKVIHRDDQHRIESEIFLNDHNRQMYYLKFAYDQDGNLATIEKFYPSGAKVRYYDFNYTASEILGGEIKYNENGKIIHFYKYTYK